MTEDSKSMATEDRRTHVPMKLELTNLTKRYGPLVALDNFSTTFAPGIYGVLGANVAGKSTMINLITDNVKRDGGSVTFDGEDILKLGDKFRAVLGYMPQQQGIKEPLVG